MYVEPFHVYELQDVTVAPPFVVLELMLRFSVAVFTQPDAFNEV